MNNINLPQNPKITQVGENRATIVVEGCWPGYGVTLGNAIRRTLLSSLPGAAVTAVKIKGIQHEFSTIPHVLENVIDIILNLKKLSFKLYSGQPQIAILKVKGEKEVTAKNLECPSQVEVVSKDVLIATLTDKKAELEAEIEIAGGIGFLPTEQRKGDKVDIGKILVDGIFTPIRKVNFEVSNMRVGDRTDFNKLTFDIETDGSMTPEQAFNQAAEILVAQFKALGELVRIEAGDEDLFKQKKAKSELKVDAEDDSKIKFDDMNLSSRTVSALINAGIRTIGGVAKKTEADLMGLKGMGDKGIAEIKKALKKIKMSLKGEN